MTSDLARHRNPPSYLSVPRAKAAHLHPLQRVRLALLLLTLL